MLRKPARPIASFALAAITVAGCARRGPPPEPAALDGARAFAETAAFVALGPKAAGTDGAARAAAWLRDRLEALGWTVEVDQFTEPAAGRPTTFRNIVGRRPGAKPDIVIFGAHYDTKDGIPGFQGANDSGSGVGVLLEIARAGAAWRWPCEPWLVFFDGEECRVAYGPADGLHGSRRLAARLVRERLHRRVRAVIIVDMVGDRDLGFTLPRNSSPELAGALMRAAERLGVRDLLRLAPGPILDDHVPFLEAGMPAVDLIDFEYGSAPGRNDYWHTPQDTLDRLSPRSLEIAARLALATALDALARAPAEHGQSR
ncbi:MAG: M28 family peptidase [Kiritimatiellae bacterium]|nr:M28 family peptidase [Kiritimatiellia bacterium]